MWVTVVVMAALVAAAMDQLHKQAVAVEQADILVPAATEATEQIMLQAARVLVVVVVAVVVAAQLTPVDREVVLDYLEKVPQAPKALQPPQTAAVDLVDLEVPMLPLLQHPPRLKTCIAPVRLLLQASVAVADAEQTLPMVNNLMVVMAESGSYGGQDVRFLPPTQATWQHIP
jgi:hypothetical protein